MNAKTINISFPPKMVGELDRVAKDRAANRSELIRDAVRIYLENQREWRALFAYGEAQAKKLGITEKDVENAVREIRGKKPLP